VPTVRELGYPALELEGWNGLFVAAKTPKEIIDRLQQGSGGAAKASRTREALCRSCRGVGGLVARGAGRHRAPAGGPVPPIIQTIKLE
jgi:hypothetical protein